MSDSVQVEQRMCRFAGCERPAVAAEAGSGRPPEYCEDEAHNRAAAWRARRRLSGEPTRGIEDEKRPVDAARQRASEIRGQVAGMVEHLGAQLNALVEELRTVADPDAAEAQIEAVTSEAAEQVASALARATRAEQAMRKAEAERVEADAAAVEASELVEQLQAALAETHDQLAVQALALEQASVELAEIRSAGEARDRAAQGELVELRDQLASTQARLTETERARADSSVRAEAAVMARAEADERARAAVARADGEAGRAVRAEADLVVVREQLDQLRTERETLREEVSAVRSTVATVNTERDAARADADRERVHGDQRVGDLRTSQDQQFQQVRTELTEARQDAREQRTRADTAEARATPPAAGKTAAKR